VNVWNPSSTVFQLPRSNFHGNSNCLPYPCLWVSTAVFPRGALSRRRGRVVETYPLSLICATHRRDQQDQCRFCKLHASGLVQERSATSAFQIQRRISPVIIWSLGTRARTMRILLRLRYIYTMLCHICICPIKCRLAEALMPFIRAELAHLGKNAICRPIDMAVRINCGKQTYGIYCARLGATSDF
jgi:hypothetical protein